MPKKTCGRGAAYISAKKSFLITNVGMAKPISEGGWERVHSMHLSVYAHKNQTIESLNQCFTTLHCTKAPTGDPSIPVEVREEKLAWLQIHIRSECSMGLSDKEEDDSIFSDGVEEEEDNDDSTSKELLGP
eukprot:5386217-Ditylum_brightwellii.AAC.1